MVWERALVVLLTRKSYLRPSRGTHHGVGL